MVTNKRKKNVKYRASRSHGYGSHKKHRGGGHRGGRGRAGSGKRGDSKKTKFWKNPDYFGKYGFVSKVPKVKIYSVNIDYLQDKLQMLLDKKIAIEKAGVYEIDVSKLGFNKVLGNRNLSKKFKIISYSFSESAIEKIKSAGGEAILLKGEAKETVSKSAEPKKENIKSKETKAKAPSKKKNLKEDSEDSLDEN